VASFFKEEHSPESGEDDLTKIKTSASVLIQTFVVHNAGIVWLTFSRESIKW
jgi:hypothetical protein